MTPSATTSISYTFSFTSTSSLGSYVSQLASQNQDNWTITGGIILIDPGNTTSGWGENYNPYPYTSQNILGIQGPSSSITKSSTLSLVYGSYTFSFYAIKRSNYNPNGIRITISNSSNNYTINYYSSTIPSTWTQLTSSPIVIASGSYTIKVEGIGSISATTTTSDALDRTTFIQGLSIIKQ
jgi:hypothetical protein